jgi:SNF2 family DNA or RNA helicase
LRQNPANPRVSDHSFKSQRIQFEPYQYKPLLKILDSPDRRLLIADEVGLGKTIEAGLILTELQARRPLDRVLVVCPSRLRNKLRRS